MDNGKSMMRYFPPNGTAGWQYLWSAHTNGCPVRLPEASQSILFDDHLYSPPLNSNLYFRMIIPPSNRRIFSLLFSLRKLFPIALLYGCASALLRQEFLPILPLPLELPFCGCASALLRQELLPILPLPLELPFCGCASALLRQELLPILPLPLSCLLRVRFGFASAGVSTDSSSAFELPFCGCASALLRQEFLPILPLPLELPFAGALRLYFGRSFCRFFLCL